MSHAMRAAARWARSGRANEDVYDLQDQVVYLTNVYARKGEVFVTARRSALVPALDLDLVVRCMQEPTQTAAVQALRAALAKKRAQVAP